MAARRPIRRYRDRRAIPCAQSDAAYSVLPTMEVVGGGTMLRVTLPAPVLGSVAVDWAGACEDTGAWVPLSYSIIGAPGQLVFDYETSITLSSYFVTATISGGRNPSGGGFLPVTLQA